MVLDYSSFNDGDHRLDAASTAADREYFSDGQSSSSDSLSDDGSSRDSLSSVSSISSSSLEYSAPLSRFSSTECRYGQLYRTANKSQANEHTTWLETVNNSSVAHVLPPEQRLNPRRSGQVSTITGEAKPPCSLIRQSERKDCFVAILVGFAAQLVEAIWPLAASTPRTDTCFFGRGVLPLRTFITETLRRSRTSYSTLQVALYYLVLIKDQIPKTNFCMEQPKAEDEFRTMQCGRRMFLTALILASKYLQDRNYSTRAWSKISGLRAKEIHVNELNYCKTIAWSLHVPQEKFQQWSRIVLRLSAPSRGPGSETLAQHLGWSTVLGKLNADLTETFENLEGIPMEQRQSPDLSTLSPNANFTFGDNSLEKQGLEAFKGILNPDVVAESVPSTPESISRPTTTIPPPPLPRIHNLPTPQTTPQLNSFKNPCSGARLPSMAAAMSQARNACMMRATLDLCPPPSACSTVPENRCAEPLGRSSLCRSTTSLASSPDSMISDVSSISSRGSRSSSISSMASTISNSSHPSRVDRLVYRRAAGVGASRSSLNELYRSHSKSKSSVTLEPTIRDSDMESELDYSSPDSNDGNTASDDRPSYAQTWNPSISSNKLDWKLQELEVAAALCRLRPTPNPTHPIEYGSNAATPQPSSMVGDRSSSQSTPHASYLNRPAPMVSRESSFTQVTPKAQGPVGAMRVSDSPSKPHKRTHSKATDPLQQEVRMHLRSWTGDVAMPAMSPVDFEFPRQHPSQSPSLTYGVLKTPVSIMGGDNSKRWCADEVSAADQATRWLRTDLSQLVSAVPL